jgi:hypothetical protein
MVEENKNDQKTINDIKEIFRKIKSCDIIIERRNYKTKSISIIQKTFEDKKVEIYKI